MWAQLITLKVKPGTEGEIAKVIDLLAAAEQPGSGLLRGLFMQDQNDPTRIFALSVFESEELARKREADPRRQEATDQIQQLLREVAAGPPEFADLAVMGEFTP